MAPARPVQGEQGGAALAPCLPAPLFLSTGALAFCSAFKIRVHQHRFEYEIYISKYEY